MNAEAELVKKLKVKDGVAFEQLITEHGPKIYRVASRMVGVQEAEDIMQETLLRVYEKINNFHGRSALNTWIYRIVTNSCLMRLRSRSPEKVTDPAGPEFCANGDFANRITDWGIPPEDAALRREVFNLLQQNIARLPESYRVVYVLAEIEGLSHDEIAATLNLNPATVKTRLHRARLFLREALQYYFSSKRQKPSR